MRSAAMAEAPHQIVEPELLAQLKEADLAGRPVAAIFWLRGADELSGAEVKERVKKLLEQAQRASGASLKEHNVFGNLGSFVVLAPPAFVRWLLGQSQSIERAGPNNLSKAGSML